VTQLLKDTEGPIVATTDYMRAFAEQIRAFMPKDRSYRVLGTDGFGRSDSRAKLREFFEVNRYYITVAALKSLAEKARSTRKWWSRRRQVQPRSEQTKSGDPINKNGANAMSIVEVKVPDIGDFKEVEIIELMVKVGDTIKVDQSLITVESDKASMEIPSSAAGVVKEIKVKVGDKVAEGSLVLLLEATALPLLLRPLPHPHQPLLRLPLRRHRPAAARRRRPGRSQSAGHRRLQGSGSHRSDGQGGRHHQGRPVAADRGIGQGRWKSHRRTPAWSRSEGQGRRQGRHGLDRAGG
jgi:biotin carboxyl carrier protein